MCMWTFEWWNWWMPHSSLRSLCIFLTRRKLFDNFHFLINARNTTSTTPAACRPSRINLIISSSWERFSEARDQLFLGNSAINLLAPYLSFFNSWVFQLKLVILSIAFVSLSTRSAIVDEPGCSQRVSYVNKSRRKLRILTAVCKNRNLLYGTRNSYRS